MTNSATASRFTEKVCVVTGAGGGIGSAIARRLAREAATVVVCDVDGAAADKVLSEITAEGETAEGLLHQRTACPDRGLGRCSCGSAS